MEKDVEYMTRALDLARQAAAEGEVPVGCVIVRDGRIVGEGRNRREGIKNALAHAEIEAIDQACRTLGGWRLIGCTLYVTLEPCPMCAGAILHARIPRVVFGSLDPIAGAMGSVWALHRHPVENKHTKVELGCLEEECREVLQKFFRERRGGNES